MRYTEYPTETNTGCADGPATLIHEQDFEAAALGSTAGCKNKYVEGWFSPAGTVAVKTDSTGGIKNTWLQRDVKGAVTYEFRRVIVLC